MTVMRQRISLVQGRGDQRVEVLLVNLAQKHLDDFDRYWHLLLQQFEQEESYTSKASALDRDEIPVYGEKPEGWKPSGKRVKRGLYRAANGTDANGSWNIGRKANVTGMQGTPARGVLTSPKRLRLWDLPQADPIRSAKTLSGESPSL